jgi:hypothetical protein
MINHDRVENSKWHGADNDYGSSWNEVVYKCLTKPILINSGRRKT